MVHDELHNVAPLGHGPDTCAPLSSSAESECVTSGTEKGKRTNVPARELFANRPVDLVPELVPHQGELFGRQRVRVHVRVHCWEEVHGDEGGEGAEEGGLRVCPVEGWSGACETRKGGEEGQRTRMLSQMPWVILARVLAEQGATRTTSAHRRSWCSAGEASAPVRVIGMSDRARTSMCSTGSPIFCQPCAGPGCGRQTAGARRGPPSRE